MWRMANLSFQKEDFRDALNIYHLILYLDENLDAVWVSYGQCLQAFGEPEKALEAFKKGHEVNPDNPHLYWAD